MDKNQLEQRMLELKQDYIRIQGDMEKLESVGRNTDKMEQQLIAIEKEIADLRQKLIK